MGLFHSFYIINYYEIGGYVIGLMFKGYLKKELKEGNR